MTTVAPIPKTAVCRKDELRDASSATDMAPSVRGGIWLTLLSRFASSRWGSRLQGGRVLLVGATGGVVENWLADRGALEITCIDPDRARIEILQRRYPEFEYQVGNLGCEMPHELRQRTFDVVVAGMLDDASDEGSAAILNWPRLVELCDSQGGLLLWTTPVISRNQVLSGSNEKSSDSGQTFSGFGLSRLATYPITYKPGGDAKASTSKAFLGGYTGSLAYWQRLLHRRSTRSTVVHGHLAIRRERSGREREKTNSPTLPTSGDPSASQGAETTDHSDWRRWIQHAPVVTTRGGDGGGRVLLISYTFPPTGGSGVQRPGKLVKYLPEFDWDVEVLAAGHERFPWHDPTLLADLPANRRVHRVPGHEPACIAHSLTTAFGKLFRFAPDRIKRFLARRTGSDISQWVEDRLYWRLAALSNRFGWGDGESLWEGPAVRAALRRHRQCPFDAVISTGPPVFVHHVARRVARATGLPWLADVRDPFVSDHDRAHPDPVHIDRMRRLERSVMNQAALVVTTCEALADDFRRRYPQRDPATIRAITNGFDRGDLVAALNMDHGASRASHDECVLVAAGAFYGQRELARLAIPLGRVLDRHPEWQGRVRLVVAGTLDGQQRRHWEQNAPAWMTLAGYLEHGAVIELLARSACAVMIVPDCNHTRLCLPGKMFELLALPTHLLALVPAGSETERLVVRAGASTLAPFEEADQVEQALVDVIERHFEGTLQRERTWPALDVYDRRSIAAAFDDGLTVAAQAGR